MGRRRDPHAASKGTTTRGIGSALSTGKANDDDAMRAVIRNLIPPFLLMLDLLALISAALSGLRPAATGQGWPLSLFRPWNRRRRDKSEQRNYEPN